MILEELIVIVAKLQKVGESSNLSELSPLLGSHGVVDSLRLVELCLKLEDVANREGFEFDWISDKAMSNNNSVFKSIGSLLEEFENQRLKSK